MERVARIARCDGSSASASSIACANASGSEGGTCHPVSPRNIVSRAPPWSLAMIGRPMACASTGMRPNPSGSVDADTTTVESI